MRGATNEVVQRGDAARLSSVALPERYSCGTHSMAEATSQLRPNNQPLLSSTPKSQTSSSSSALWLVLLPAPIPSPSMTSPTCLPPAHAPLSFLHPSAADERSRPGKEDELMVGRAAISRQSRIWPTVDGPPEYERTDGAVRVCRSGGMRIERLR